MLLLHQDSQAGRGLFPARYTVQATCRETTTGVTAGDVVQFTLDAESVTEVDNNTPGSSDGDGDNSGLNNVILPNDTGGSLRFGIFGIALENIADDAVGEVLVYGIVNANVDAACVAGSPLIAAADGQLDIATINGDKIIALGLQADVSNFADVWFNGLTGWGMEVES